MEFKSEVFCNLLVQRKINFIFWGFFFSFYTVFVPPSKTNYGPAWSILLKTKYRSPQKLIKLSEIAAIFGVFKYNNL